MSQPVDPALAVLVELAGEVLAAQDGGDHLQVYVEDTWRVSQEWHGSRVGRSIRSSRGAGVTRREGVVWRHGSVPTAVLAADGPGPRVRDLAREATDLAASGLPSGVPDPPSVRDGDAATRTYVESVLRRFAVVDSEGLVASGADRSCRGRVECAAAVDGVHARSFARALLHKDGHRLAGEDWWARLQREASRRSTELCLATRAGRRTTPVVLLPGVGAALLHELVGHGYEDDNLSSGTPYARALPGLRATSQLSLVDDAEIPDGYGTITVDDDGSRVGRTTLIAGGTPVDALTSARSSYRSGRRRTGNGRRSSFQRMSLPRATNTVVEAGPASPADLLHVPPEGLLVIRAWASGQVDVATGEFVFVAADAELERAAGSVLLRDVVIHGDALDLLERVVAVGADVAADPATCGKGDQVVPVGFASPTMRVQDVTWQTR